jgi:sugar O-acyltransferase (sialic acid O-acetyltransferase NeuD family)
MPTDRTILVGAGGHAAVVLEAMRASGASDPVVLDDDPLATSGPGLLGVRVSGPADASAAGAAAFHVAIGGNAVRARKHSEFSAAGGAALTVIHPGASVSASSVLGAGAFVAAHAVVGPRARVGAGAIVNHGAVVDHDCVVADFAHVAPNATLGGGAKVGERALVGAGATVLPGIAVGHDSVVGAGGVACADVAPGSTVVGVPVREVGRHAH